MDAFKVKEVKYKKNVENVRRLLITMVPTGCSFIEWVEGNADSNNKEWSKRFI